MTATTEPSASWLKLRNDLLSSLNQGKQDVSLPFFPKKKLESLLKDKFRLEECEVSISARGSVVASQIAHEFGNRILIQPLSVQPLEKGEVFFLSAEEDLQRVMEVVFGDASLASYFYEKDKLLGFHYYFMSEMCGLFQECGWPPAVTMKVTDDAQFSTRFLTENYHTVLVTCLLDSMSVNFAFLVPENTYESGKKFFAGQTTEIDVNQMDLMQTISMVVEVGDCKLSEEEWKQVAPGAFILLDSCLYDPDSKESGAYLSIHGTRFFGGRFLEGSSGEFKITSFPTLQQDAEEDAEHHEETPTEHAQYKLIAEVARYTMTLDEFLKLSPGSVLQFQGQSPSMGVNLVVNGEVKGRGEIISIGDVLGIRVISM